MPQFSDANVQLVDQSIERSANEEQIFAAASAMLRRKELHEAYALFARLLKGGSCSIDAVLGTVVCLVEMGRADEGLDLLDRQPGMANVGAAAEFAYWRGMLMDMLGRGDDAREQFLRALDLRPSDTRALLALANSVKLTDQDTLWHKLVSLAEQSSDAVGRPRARVLYALAKIHADNGDFARAAALYEQGGAALLGAERFEEASLDRYVSFVTEALDETWVKRAKVNNDSDCPIFILGMPRSGTTLVEQILCSHPSVGAGGELPYIPQIVEPLFSNVDRVLNPSDVLQRGAVEYLRKLRMVPRSRGCARISDKLPMNFMYIGFIAAMFPGARIIHCRRDPRDTCLSCYTTMFSEGLHWSFDLEATGRMYLRYFRLMEHWKRIFPGRIIDVCYEQLIADPDVAIRQLVAQSGLEWSDNCMGFHRTQRAVSTASLQQVRKPMYRTSVGRWKPWVPYINPMLKVLASEQSLFRE